MDVKIIVAAHKQYDMPQDEIYMPIHVGAEGKQPLPYQPDNEGENISSRNPSFCELTGLYWAWKHLDCAYLGLAHYRRHFSVKSKAYRKKHKKSLMKCVLSGREAEQLLTGDTVIVPKRREYFIETLYSHYAHTHYADQLDLTRMILLERCPEYVPTFDRVMMQTYGYMFNMFLMKKDLADAYCTWLFDVLFELERRIGEREYSAFQGRFYGRISEILFNVWLEQNELPVREIPCIHMEPINWRKKGMAFLRAKFGKEKYQGSF